MFVVDACLYYWIWRKGARQGILYLSSTLIDIWFQFHVRVKMQKVFITRTILFWGSKLQNYEIKRNCRKHVLHDISFRLEINTYVTIFCSLSPACRKTLIFMKPCLVSVFMTILPYTYLYFSLVSDFLKLQYTYTVHTIHIYIHTYIDYMEREGGVRQSD